MNANEMFPSKYLKASDLGEHKVTATIQSVKVESLGTEDDQERKPVIYFEGKEKGLVCNKTNWNTIIDLHGPETDNWIGKKIKIQAMEVQFKGKMTMAIRVSLMKPIENKVTVKEPASEDANEEVDF